MATVELGIPLLHGGETEAVPSFILFINLAFGNVSTFTFVFLRFGNCAAWGISDLPLLYLFHYAGSGDR